MVKNQTANLSVLDLWSSLDRAVFAISRLREIEVSQFGLTTPQAAILHLIDRQGGTASLQDLEKNRMRQHHSISALVSRMAKIGLVKKSKASNGKKYQINVSPEGLKAYRSLTEASFQMVFSSFSAKQKIELANILIPLLEKARYLLGMSQTTPFVANLTLGKNKSAPGKKNAKPIPISDYDLWILFDRVGFAISRMREIELSQFGLTLPQASILHALQTHAGSMTLPEVEDFTMRQPHSIFMLIKRMVKIGLISYTRDRHGKKNQLSITEKGEKSYNQVTTASFDLTLSTLSKAEQRRLAAFLSPLLERARYLLGIAYVPPILQYLNSPGTLKKQPGLALRRV